MNYNYGKSPCSKTINQLFPWPCSIAMLHYQAGYIKQCYCFWKPRSLFTIQNTSWKLDLLPSFPVSSFRPGEGLANQPRHSISDLSRDHPCAAARACGEPTPSRRMAGILGSRQASGNSAFFDLTSCFVIPRFYYLDVLSEYHPILKISKNKLYWLFSPYRFLQFSRDFSLSKKYRLAQNTGRSSSDLFMCITDHSKTMAMSPPAVRIEPP